MDPQRRILALQPERQHNGKPLLAAAAGLLALTGAAATAAGFEYALHFDASLERLDVEARFERPVTRIAARARDASRFLSGARDCDTGATLSPRGRRLTLPPAGVRCLAYSVDLAGVAAAADIPAPAGIRSAEPAVWLWRPRLDGGDRVRMHVDLPEGMQLAVPWQAVPGQPGSYEFGDSPRSGRATMFVGHFDQATRSVAGTDIRITLLAPPGTADVETHADWVAATARNVTLAYGRFPNSSISVVLFPMTDSRRGGTSAVPFGRVVRDGGESIELLVNLDRPVEEFYSEWTPTHEFAHLMHPYLSHRHRWISEGMATYYQNILLARAGAYTESEAWRRLLEGFERGRESVPALSPNAAASGPERNTRMKVYWSGAALALMADTELRRRSEGRESLDSVLGQLQHCCLPADDGWTGPEFFGALDGFLDEPVFMPLYRRYADRTGFPDVDAVLADLGVSLSDTGVRFDASAPLAGLRHALLTPPE